MVRGMAVRKVSVGLVQMRVSASKEANLTKAIEKIGDAARQGAEVICLQELFASPYFCQVEDPENFELAEPVTGPTTQAITRVAKELGVTVLIPFFERRAPGVYHNSIVAVGPQGESLGLYRKMHIPDDPQYYEKFYFTPGDLGFVAFESPKAKLGPLICWDQWYPEAARLTALRGAELLFYPTAIGWLPEDKPDFGSAQLEAWQIMQRAHAVANGVFVVSVNRVGEERSPAGSIEFWGHSFVCDPFGRVLAEAGSDEAVLVVDCDLSLIEQTRRGWPFLRDRRIDAYTGITARLLDGP